MLVYIPRCQPIHVLRNVLDAYVSFFCFVNYLTNELLSDHLKWSKLSVKEWQAVVVLNSFYEQVWLCTALSWVTAQMANMY